MNDERFSKERIRLIRELAEKADRFTKRRLNNLIGRYDGRSLNAIPHPLANLSSEPNYSAFFKPAES
jgi:hypothetical protein